MDWSDSAEQAAFRTKVQGVIDQMPERYKREGGDWERDRNNEDPSRQNDAKQWTAALAKEGWVAPHWPKEYGGAGLSPMEQFIFKMEMARADAQRRWPGGLPARADADRARHG